jgi:hypothetical protein
MARKGNPTFSYVLVVNGLILGLVGLKLPGIKKIMRHAAIIPLDRKRTDRYKICPIKQ